MRFAVRPWAFFAAPIALVACNVRSNDALVDDDASPPPASAEAGASAFGYARPMDVPEPSGDAAASQPPPDAAPGARPPYVCAAPPAQCHMTCSAPACTLECNASDATDCRYKCAPPQCACDGTPTARCDLYEPEAICDVKCERPRCATYCPACTTPPCGPCENVCEPTHCVTHCQAPRIDPADGGHRVVHCQAPRPSCHSVCETLPDCTWEPDPPCDPDAGACPAPTSYRAVCSAPLCHNVCASPPPARCQVIGCDESCDPLTGCTTTCEKPACAPDGDGGVACDAPSNCTTQCNGGACRVTTCL